MKKKVDQRIRTLVENNVKLRQRSVFVIVGDRGRDQARAAPQRQAQRRRSDCAAALRASGAVRGPADVRRLSPRL